MTERMAQLALSQKGAKVLMTFIVKSIDTSPVDLDDDEDRILAAIVQDLDDQIETKPKKAKKVKKVKKVKK